MELAGKVLTGAFAAAGIASLAAMGIGAQEERRANPNGGLVLGAAAVPAAFVVGGLATSMLGRNGMIAGDAGTMLVVGALAGTMLGTTIGAFTPKFSGAMNALHGALGLD